MSNILVEETRYELTGIVVVTLWHGQRGFARVKILTDEKGIEEIIKNPRQDYLSFGVKSVDYVELYVYTIKVSETENKIITERSKKPDYLIADGEYKLTPKEEEELFESEEIIVHY